MSLLDIHSIITYEKLAPILGLEPTSKLSGTLKCPYCAAHTWSIYQDNCSLEQWHYCSNCKKTGTVLAMAADRLGITEHEVIGYVSEYHDYSFNESDLKLFAKSEAKFRNFYSFWERTSNALHSMSKEHIGLLTGLHWNYFRHLDKDRITNGPGKLLGVSNSAEVEKFLKLRKLNRVLPIIAVPYFSSFQRVKGFQIITPKFNQFKECLFGSQRISKLDEGLAGLLLLDRFDSDTIVVTSMLDNMIHMQMRNFQTSTIPLPLLSWKLPQKPTQKPQWDILAGKRLCFWERKPTAAVIYHAMHNNGFCSFTGPYSDRNNTRSNQWVEWLNYKAVISLYQGIVRGMSPVEKAIKSWLQQASKEEKTKLILDAEQFDSSVLNLVQSKLTSKAYVIPAKKVVTSLVNESNPLSSKGSVTIIERDGKWFDSTGAIRFAATMRIQYLVAYPGGAKHYVGYVEHNETKYPFNVNVAEAGTAWLKRFISDNAIISLADPIAMYSANRFSPFEVALRLHEPAVVQGIDRVGWDGQGFQFKNCRIIEGEAKEIPAFSMLPGVPGPSQSEYRMREEFLERINDSSKEMSICWATGIALCAQLTSPAVDMPTYGIFMIRMSCDVFLHTLLTRFSIKASDSQDWKHNWPRFFNNSGSAFRKDTNGFFVTMGYASTLDSHKQLMLISASSRTLQPRFIPVSCEKIVMQYLRKFTETQHKRPRDWQQWLKYTVANTKNYFSSVDPKIIDLAAKRIKLL